MSKLIKNGTLVFKKKKKKTDLLIDGEKIIQIGDNLTGDEVIDAEGCFVFSGFIDGHTHLDMPVSGTVTADDFSTGTAAALAGGTTMIIDFATQDRGHTLKEALDIWHKRNLWHFYHDYRCCYRFYSMDMDNFFWRQWGT